MIKWILLVLFAFANITIRDTEGNVMLFSSTGKIKIDASKTGVKPIVTYARPSRTIRDTDGHLLEINTNGSINLK